jgi:hypothetical protein
METKFFEFNQWREAFEYWHQQQQQHQDMQLVISTGTCTSGYWVERRGLELINGDHLYTGDGVLALEKRVTDEIALAVQEGRSVKFTI